MSLAFSLYFWLLIYFYFPYRSLRMTSILLNIESGDVVDSPHCHYLKVKAFAIQPLEDRGIIDIDGEASE